VVTYALSITTSGCFTRCKTHAVQSIPRERREFTERWLIPASAVRKSYCHRNQEIDAIVANTITANPCCCCCCCCCYLTLSKRSLRLSFELRPDGVRRQAFGNAKSVRIQIRLTFTMTFGIKRMTTEVTINTRKPRRKHNTCRSRLLERPAFRYGPRSIIWRLLSRISRFDGSFSLTTF